MPYQELQEYKNNASYLKVGAHNIAYWTHFATEVKSEGTVPTVLFIHGFPSAAWDWHNQWHFLKNEFDGQVNLIAFDLLGFGLSDKPAPYSYSLVEQASIAESLIKYLKIKHCHVLAHDYGDSVAQVLLQKHDETKLAFDIDSVCYLNGGLFAESHRPLLTQKLLKSKLGPLVSKFMSKGSLKKSFHKIFGPNTPPSDAEIETIWTLLNHNEGISALHYLLAYIDERHLYRDAWVSTMQTTKVKQYFINGIHDPISGKHMLKKFEALIPNAKAMGIEYGHYPQLENPQLIDALFLEFIDAVRAS
jgi:pimeloyl-ACP methyl ester carboxylesterase